MNIQTIWVSDHNAYPCDIHAHGYYQMIYCKKEGGSFEIDGVRYKAAEGHLYFIQPFQPHGIQSDGNMHVTELKFAVLNERFAAHLALLPTELMPKDSLAFRRSLSDILREGQSQALYCNEATNAAMELILIRLLRPYAEEEVEPLRTLGYDVQPSVSPHVQKRMDERVAMLFQWIELHMAENISLDVMSQLVHLNKSYLTECFNRMCGMPPMKYVNWVRLERARELLISTEKSITDIAAETGFGRIHYFSRYFKEKEFMTPQDYRAMYRK